MDSSREYIQMEMECEPKKSIQRDLPCGRQTGILVLLGTVCMIIFMVMTFVIYSHQERKFSMLESWMNSHTSDLTSVKSDLQITGNDLEKKADELQTLVSIMSSHLNVSGSNHSMARESLSSSLSDLKSSVSDLTSSVASLSSKQQTSEERVLNALKELITNMNNKTAGDSMVTCKSGWVSYKSSCFLFSRNRLNWTDARDYCKEQGALLLKIQEDDQEWAFLNKRTIPTAYWVGLTDQTTGQWRWVDDTPYVMNEEHWDPDQPDDWKDHGLGEEGEDCGQIAYTGKLNDNHCSTKMRFICRVQY